MLAAVLAPLSLLGYWFASAFLVALIGMAVGEVFAYPAGHAFQRSFATRLGRWIGVAAFAVGLACIVAVVMAGSYLIGAPALTSQDGGMAPAFVFGLAIGFGGALRRGLAPLPWETLEGRAEARAAGGRVLVVDFGAVAGLFALFFIVYFLFERVAAPLIRYLAG